jgi:ribosomal protein S18 acetylase RimI-like enzyme
MKDIQYREATQLDISALSEIRATEWETEKYWNHRISDYLIGDLNPTKSLSPRIIYVAITSEAVIGFIAGHLTQRFNCDGELQWINVIPGYRRNGIASEMLRLLAKWFVNQNAFTICVDPGNELVRRFYIKNGAENLNEHWMVWKEISKLLK